MPTSRKKKARKAVQRLTSDLDAPASRHFNMSNLESEKEYGSQKKLEKKESLKEVEKYRIMLPTKEPFFSSVKLGKMSAVLKKKFAICRNKGQPP